MEPLEPGITNSGTGALPGVCVWNIWIDVKLLPVDSWCRFFHCSVWFYISNFCWLRDYQGCCFISPQFLQQGSAAWLWDRTQRSYHNQWDTGSDQPSVPAISINLRFAISRQWQPAKPRTGMSTIWRVSRFTALLSQYAFLFRQSKGKCQLKAVCI